MMTAGKALSVTAVLLVGVAVGCSSPDAREDETEAGDVSGAPAAEESSAGLNDAEIAAIVVAANSIDVRHGELARERAADERVREFAETMIRDHRAVNESAGALVARLGVTPEENDVSRSLQSSADQTIGSLTALTGAEFDRAYMAHEVDYHRAVLNALDELLIPNATNAELRETLVGVRPAFEAHLEHAQTLQQSLGT
jgi:putative membrane protein